jgi:arginine decarboxylase
MATTATGVPHLDHFFSTSSARLDRWRELNAKAQIWAASARSGNPRGGRAAVEAALAEVRPLEDFFAYPGLRLMKVLAERIADNDVMGVARLVLRLSGALLSGSYRYDTGQWDTAEESATAVADRLPLAPDGGGDARRPYFETLFVSPAPAANLQQIAHEIRRLRRVEDAMIYEPVLVGSFEDAILGTVLNGKIEAVVIYDGIPIPSQHDVPLLREFLTTYQQLDTSTLAPREHGASSASAPSSTSTC